MTTEKVTQSQIELYEIDNLSLTPDFKNTENT